MYTSMSTSASRFTKVRTIALAAGVLAAATAPAGGEALKLQLSHRANGKGDSSGEERFWEKVFRVCLGLPTAAAAPDVETAAKKELGLVNSSLELGRQVQVQEQEKSLKDEEQEEEPACPLSLIDVKDIDVDDRAQLMDDLNTQKTSTTGEYKAPIYDKAMLLNHFKFRLVENSRERVTHPMHREPLQSYMALVNGETIDLKAEVEKEELDKRMLPISKNIVKYLEGPPGHEVVRDAQIVGRSPATKEYTIQVVGENAKETQQWRVCSSAAYDEKNIAAFESIRLV